jgi:hypothetical protein
MKLIPLFLLLLTVIPWPHRYTVSIPNLNNGGCGWYAYYLSGKLPGSVIVSLRNGRHYMVFNGWGYCDSRGVWLPPAVWLWSYGDIEPITREELRERLNGPGWNEAFDLGDTVKIKSIINK